MLSGPLSIPTIIPSTATWSTAKSMRFGAHEALLAGHWPTKHVAHAVLPWAVPHSYVAPPLWRNRMNDDF